MHSLHTLIEQNTNANTLLMNHSNVGSPVADSQHSTFLIVARFSDTTLTFLFVIHDSIPLHRS